MRGERRDAPRRPLGGFSASFRDGWARRMRRAQPIAGAVEAVYEGLGARRAIEGLP
ncbi:hypothetical protein [Sorangium sp. So ce1153]|uniref:hypothetical protein n=1 Tax=Sorangium sp. So ce1153 TaxID=3133333 RepID=UPI003F5FF222